MTNIERAEQHRDQVEMELAEMTHLLEMMIDSDMATLHEVEDMEKAIAELQLEAGRAKDEVTMANLELAFRNLTTKELNLMIRSKNTDWKVKEAAQRVKDQRDEMKWERKVS